ncbi:hypothetical protein B0A48_09842 [Cryoendolithus antarcticus]|uniref:Uncharacterized protein n=1 Tax=Cryoendolithus antarcticus TaxID=1507870 RepID=A0A1V8T3F4_9PEZI|nr:hypothetical protein B0A48_09842 [Cryoendolithus antarcticus]
MEKLKGVAKGGWKPETDRAIHRDTWKSDLLHRGKQTDPYAKQRETHQSQPLTALKDPSQFAPPPKHSAYYGPDGASPSRTGTGLSAMSSASTARGLGASAPLPVRRPDPREEEQAPKPPPEPYRKDTTGLRTDNLPAPPVRRAGPGTSSPAPVPPPRTKPLPPPRVNSGPPPILPPRQNEYPDEHAPPPPPTYGEATRPAIAPNPAAINRLAQAGVSVPGFGIGSSRDNASAVSVAAGLARRHPEQITAAAGYAQRHPEHVTAAAKTVQNNSGQLSELQLRFSRMGTASSSSAAPVSPTQAASQQQATPSWRTGLQAASSLASAKPASPALPTAATGKKPAPPPPAKRVGLSTGEASVPPPIPMSSKPRPP